MPSSLIKSFRPSFYVPNTSFTGNEPPTLLRGENVWLRLGRTGSVYAECSKGHTDIGESYTPVALTGTVAWTAGSKTLTGSSTTFFNELHLGQFILGKDGSTTELFSIEKIISNTSAIVSRAPTTSATGVTAYQMPVMQPLGTDRAYMLRGNVVQFPKGHLLGVGSGEVTINGTGLSSTFTLSRTPQFALFNPTTGTYTQDDVGITLPTATPLLTLAATTPATPTQMRAGSYNVRVCAKNTQTLGFSQPSAVIAPVTLTNGQAIEVTFNDAMATDQDAWDIYCTEFADNTTSTIQAAYMGAWYLVKTVKAADLIDGGHPTGRETGTKHEFFFSDAEMNSVTQVLSFDNFAPVDAEFIGLSNGIAIYFSCQGKGNASKAEGTSPGAVAIPSKPSNPEAVFLNKSITTVDGDIIVGQASANGRVYALCQNSLQMLILTQVDIEPIAFRSLWDCGFRNPFNVKLVKNYVYGFGTHGIVRSVAGGDDSQMEFEFATDVHTIVKDWETGHVLTGYDPQNRAVCFFYSAYAKRSGYWVTLCLPYLLDKQVWNPPIVLQRDDQDMIVSSVSTIGNYLEFTAGGRNSGGSVVCKTYRFEGGDSEDKAWYMAWNYSDDGAELDTKTIKGFTATGRFTDTIAELHAVQVDADFNLSELESGHGNADKTVTFDDSANLKRYRFKKAEFPNNSLWTVRLSGVCADGLDRIDELAAQFTVNSSEK